MATELTFVGGEMDGLSLSSDDVEGGDALAGLRGEALMLRFSSNSTPTRLELYRLADDGKYHFELGRTEDAEG